MGGDSVSKSTQQAQMDKALSDLRSMEVDELVSRRTETAWRVESISGQLLDPGNDDRDESWRRGAKLALHYSRRELAAINGVLAEKRQDAYQAGRTGDNGVLVLMRALVGLHESAVAFLSDDSDKNWDALQSAVNRCDSISFLDMA